jgi:hypothetical protein
VTAVNELQDQYEGSDVSKLAVCAACRVVFMSRAGMCHCREHRHFLCVTALLRMVSGVDGAQTDREAGGGGACEGVPQTW